jgi:YjjG family noncanonical pyrimidine nucleotidase
MSYDILLFDADRTLFDFDESEKLAFFEVAPNYGVIPTEENFELYKKINNENWHALELGLFKKEVIVVRRFEQFLEAVNANGDATKMNDEYLTALSKKSILFNDALPLLKTLKANGKRIYIITNGVTKVQEGRLHGSPIEPYLDGVFISEQMNVSKPQKLFFDLVAERIENYSPERALIIGDSLTSDIQGANNASLDCVWLNPENAPNDKGLKVTFEAKTLPEIGEFILNS